jgi:hypothetical protein
MISSVIERKMETIQVLKLDSSYRPLEIIDWQDAFYSNVAKKGLCGRIHRKVDSFSSTNV